MAVINKESLGSPAVAKHTGVSGLHDVEKSLQALLCESFR